MDITKSSSLFSFFRSRSRISLVFVIAILAGGYYLYSSATKGPAQVRYALARAERGIIVASVSGTGQISAQNQIDIKTKVSGDVVSINVKQGSEISKDMTLFQIDDRVARKSVRDAVLNLETAKLSLEKMQKPPDALALLQAQNALAQAKRELEDLQKPPDALALLQAEHAVEQAHQSYADAQKNLEKTYEDGFTSVTTAMLDLVATLNGISDTLYTNTIERSQTNSDWYTNRIMTWEYDSAFEKKNLANSAYDKARASTEATNAAYTRTSRVSPSQDREELIIDTFKAVAAVNDSVKAADTYLDFVQAVMEDKNLSVPSLMIAHQAALDTHTAKMNTRYADLQTIVRSIDDRKGSITSTERTLAEKNKYLEDLKNGPDAESLATAIERKNEREESLAKLTEPADGETIVAAKEKVNERLEAIAKLQEPLDELDIRSQKIAILERTNALEDAKEKLADYRIVAPFDAIAADVAVKPGDTVNAGAVLSTLITKTSIADLSLNEIDVSRLAIGQKATLTFDAVPDIQLTGSIVEIDTIGSVSQGVVSYAVTIAFDTDDERIKPGMSVSAAIIVDTRVDALIVPASAVKLQGEQYAIDLVEDSSEQAVLSSGGVVLANPPRRVPIEVGISNDESIEILSGIEEGSLVVMRTVDQSSTGANSASGQNPSFRIPGLPGGGSGGGFRMR